jgi:predicted alpha/beta hydrolase family esterase
MKKQVIFIHGGQTYNSYDQYLSDLKTFVVDPYTLKKKWRMTLGETLGGEYEVLVPEMPNKMNAKYREWEIWFEKYAPFLRNGVILIGHSLGASFLLRYLSQKDLPVELGGLYLIAAPFFTESTEEGGDFCFVEAQLPSIAQKVEKMVLIQSKDDKVVPFSHFERLTEVFPKAEHMIFDDRGHFNQESFPELIAHIKGV